MDVRFNMDIDDIPTPLPSNPTRFIDQLRSFIRTRGMAYKTEKTYVGWVLRYIRFHTKRHPKEMAEAEVEAFLSHLAVQQNCAANTQRTALNALVFLYREFLGRQLKDMEITRAKRQKGIPEVFSHAEANAVINGLAHPYCLLSRLMYGSGLRIGEAVKLRVQDINFAMGYIVVRDGKGGKNRRTLLPESLIESLQHQVKFAENTLRLDRDNGVGGVYLPNALARKYPNAPFQLGWQYLFPANTTSTDPRSNIVRRHHLMDRTLQKNIGKAIRLANIHRKHLPPLIRHQAVGKRLRHPHHPGVDGTRKCRNHDDLYPRTQ